MSSLKTNEKQILESLLRMGSGYVLNFSDRTISEFFKDHISVDLYEKSYDYGSGSKANRIRGFWKNAPDNLVAKSIRELLGYIDNQIVLGNLEETDFPIKISERALEIADTLDGKVNEKKLDTKVTTEAEFIKREFDGLEIGLLGLDGPTQHVISERIKEIQNCFAAKASLAVVFLCGSTLEGILLATAQNHPKYFNQASSAPKKSDQVLPFYDWKLVSLIDVSHEIGILGEDVKKHSHSLRDFRNYIHPFQQLASGFNPHHHTAKISWQVLQAAIYEVGLYQKRK